MSKREIDVQKQLQALFNGKTGTFPAKVTDIDKEAKTIAVEDVHEIKYEGVRLSAIIVEGDKVVAYPKEESWVLVSIINNEESELHVTAFSEVEELAGKIEDTLYTINAEGYSINREGENLYTVLEDLIKNMDGQNEQVQAVAEELMKVSVAIGTTPDVAALTQIVQDLAQIITDRGEIKERLNTILIEGSE